MNAVQESTIQEIKDRYGDDNIQIDPDAQISEATNGFWVQAWIYVPYPPEDDAPS